MLAAIRLTRLYRFPTSVAVKRPALSFLKHCHIKTLTLGGQCLHTSPAKSAVPPVLLITLKSLITLRSALRLFASLAGSGFREWWKNLPKYRKQNYLNKIKKNKLGIAGGGVLASLMAHWFYVSHLEIEPITGKERFCIVTPNQLKELSQQAFKTICAEYADIIIPPIHPYYWRVKQVADRLLNANRHMPQIYSKTWTVTVLDDPKNINAFVLPNGNIFVFTGMLNMCANDDELSAILGHEIAHCVIGHAAENASREHLLESLKLLLILLAWAVFPTDLLSLLGYSFGAGVIDTTLRYPYSRQLEAEADDVGIQLAAKACFDVRAAVAFWAKMHLMAELRKEESIEWLSTHPSHNSRREKLEEQLPTSVDLRNYCKCPPLPRRDPRDEVEAFKQALHRAHPAL